MAKIPKPPRVPPARDDLWQALRRLRRATARELAAVCERPKNAIQVDLRYLVRTGYAAFDGGKAGRVHRLIDDTGVRPPMFIFGPGKELLGAMDRNTKKLRGVGGAAPPAELTRRANWCPKVKAGRPDPGKPPRRLRWRKPKAGTR